MNNYEEKNERRSAQPNRPEHPEQPIKPEKPKPPEELDKLITIIVNGINKQLRIGKRHLSYEEIVNIAYGNYDESDRVIYTVAYSNGPKENPKGTLVKGQKAKVREGMIFNVSRSDKS